jgi:hypothetical protein
MMKCYHPWCDEDATRIMAWPTCQGRCLHVAPFCDNHKEGVEKMGGLPAVGPALSDEAQEIDGIR